MKGWYGDKHKHSLASRGIKTKYISKGYERYLPLTSKNLTMVIEEERDDMKSYFSITEEKINEGACGTFATRVAERFFPELVVYEEEDDDVYGKEFMILSTRPFPNFEATEKMKWCSSRLMGGHTWISYNGLHYDVEAPYGVTNPEDLPFFNRCMLYGNYKEEEI